MFLFAPRSGRIYVMRLDLRGAGIMVLCACAHDPAGGGRA